MKAEAPAYVVVGGGRWAAIMREVLAREKRSVRSITGVRRLPDETDERYRGRMSELFAGSRIAWLCVPPCAEVTLLVEAAIVSGLHVVVEKPWLLSEPETAPLARLAEEHGLVAGVHFQYCFLDAVKDLVKSGIEWKRFSGVFTLSRPDRLGLPAIHNLGSHLFAIREYVAPRSEVSEIRCGYDMTDERSVRLQSASGLEHSIELATEEPLIQRYIAAFESGVAVSQFPFDLRFAARVFESTHESG